MELELIRFKNATTFTAGKFYINGKYHSYTLEDTNRFLDSNMDLESILKIKVKTKTAIPRGKYEVVLNYSNAFKKMLPLLIDVKGFAGVRIHSGNKPEHTEGCILLGYEDSSDGFMGESKVACETFMEVFTEAIKKEKVFITIK